MFFSKVKLEVCQEQDLNKVAAWANNLPSLKRQDQQKWNLLQNSMPGKLIIRNLFVTRLLPYLENHTFIDSFVIPGIYIYSFDQSE